MIYYVLKMLCGEHSKSERAESAPPPALDRVKLLGIYFDSTLSKMHVNYENAIESVRKVIKSWKFRFLTIFGKVTVIKTMCIPKLNHIAVIVPNPSIHT